MKGMSKEDKEKILARLDEVSNEQREIWLYEIAKDMGYNHIKTGDVGAIIKRFIEKHPTYRAVKFVQDENINSPTESLFTTVRLTECEYQTEKEFLQEMGVINTIILLHNSEKLTSKEYRNFNKGDSIYGNDSSPTEIQRWNIDCEKQAKDELEKYHCSYEKNGDLYYIDEYALMYCGTDKNGEFTMGSNFELASE